MARRTGGTTEHDGLDYLYHSARRIHRLADDSLARRDGARRRGAAGRDTSADPPPKYTIPQRIVAGVAERFAAGMIVTFGGRDMVDTIGRWVEHAGKKRASSK